MLRTLAGVGLLVDRSLRAVNCLVTDTTVLVARARNLLETIVVAVHLDGVRNDKLNSVVVPQHLQGVDHAETGSLLAVLKLDFCINFVVVPRNHHVADGVSGPNFDFTVVASNHDPIAWLQQSHAHAVIRNVN